MATPTLHDAAGIAGRTLVVYVAVLALLRLAGKRELGQMSVFDLTVILLVANAVQNAMVGSDTSLPGGLVAAGTLIVVNFAVAVASSRVPGVARLLEPAPTVLVRDGVLDRRAMRRELVTREELDTALREHGHEGIEAVRQATLESDGSISIVTGEGHHHRPRKPLG